MKRIINNILSKLTVKKAVIVTGIFLVLLWLIDYSPIGVAGLLKVTGGISILDFETRYSADFAYEWLESMTEAGRSFHLTKIMPLDIVYPPAFMAFMFSWLGLLLKSNTTEDSPLRFGLLMPVIYLLLDWTENIGITLMLVNYPQRFDMVAVATGMVTSVKKVFVLLTLILFVIELIVLAFSKIKGVSHAEIKGQYQGDHTREIS